MIAKQHVREMSFQQQSVEEERQVLDILHTGMSAPTLSLLSLLFLGEDLTVTLTCIPD